jgi:peptide/nickel transport system permease protein
MFAYTVRRLLIGIPVLIAASFFLFIVAVKSGDPRDPLLVKNPPTPKATLALIAERLHLDQPLLPRYWWWLSNLVFHGNFGPSVDPTQNIGSELGRATWVTVRLVFFAMLFAVILAIVTGVLSAVRQYSKMDYTFTFAGFLALSIPSFWLAILLKEAGIFYNKATNSAFFFTIGDQNYDHDTMSSWGKITDIAGHMVLPTISLTLITYAGWSRYQRGSMLDVLNSDYIRLARAKGLRARQVMVRHALRTALIPLTTVTAIEIAGVLGGAIVTETVFNWSGMGRYLIKSVTLRDVNAILGWLLVSGIIVIVFNIIADLLYAVLDPRIRYE